MASPLNHYGKCVTTQKSPVTKSPARLRFSFQDIISLTLLCQNIASFDSWLLQGHFRSQVSIWALAVHSIGIVHICLTHVVCLQQHDNSER